MKLYISADMEGVSGVVHPSQVIPGTSDYEIARRFLTEEVNAAIEGALHEGVNEIVVNDAHGTMRNLVIDLLNPTARLVTGNRKKLCMMEGIDESFDGVIFIGYHTRANSIGVLSHTINALAFNSIKINGKEYGEAELNAIIAGFYGVPVIMVSGDDHLEKQVKELNSDIEYANVKKTITQLVAECIHPQKARELIKEKVIKAISRIEEIKPSSVQGIINVEVQFKNISYADLASFIPKVERLSPDTIGYKVDNPIELMGILFTMSNLAVIGMVEGK